MPRESLRGPVLLLVLVILSSTAQAHKIIGGVYADAALIEGEVGFSNGTMAKAGVAVEVFDPAGTKIGETITEAGGLFRFQATQRVEHRFTATLGPGHIMDISLPADELPEDLAAPHPAARDTKPDATGQPEPAPAIPRDLEAMISKAVARQIRPLRRELAAYKEKAKWHDVLGGIGYIFGLFGIAAWMQSRRKHAESTSEQR